MDKKATITADGSLPTPLGSEPIRHDRPRQRIARYVLALSFGTSALLGVPSAGGIASARAQGLAGTAAIGAGTAGAAGGLGALGANLAGLLSNPFVVTGIGLGGLAGLNSVGGIGGSSGGATSPTIPEVATLGVIAVGGTTAAKPLSPHPIRTHSYSSITLTSLSRL